MRACSSLILVAGLFVAMASEVQANSCKRGDFVAVVDGASQALGALTRKNSPLFQARLRQLKTKRSWSHDDFLKQAAPYVRDKTIAGFDAKSRAALLRIETLGSQGETASAPDCALLKELRGAMATLVATQEAKWRYMFKKIDGALKE